MILQDCWRDTRISTSESDFDHRRRTALERLAARYRRFAVMALVLVLYCPMTIYRHIENHSLSLAIAIFFSLYLLMCSAMDWYLYYSIRAIDVSSMPVDEVLTRAMHCRKHHLQFVCILLPCAALLLGGIFYAMASNPYILWGMISGAIVGLLIGTLQLRRFLADYRSLTH